ncbi:MAG TPA: glutaminase A [Limnochordia bacterium]
MAKSRPLASTGHVATYIPALGRADPRRLGISVAAGEELYQAGDVEAPFTLQSIAKLFALIVALIERGADAVFSKVGMEPTGDPFHSIIKLETVEPTKPLNPMINAGAIAVCDLVPGADAAERIGRILDRVRRICGNPAIEIDRESYLSEKETGHRNRAIAHYLKAAGVLEGDVDMVLDVYFQQCAISVTTADLARAGAVLASRNPDEALVPRWVARQVKAFMVTCGMYNASGEFAIRVGIPAKSGVSGAILACVPERGIGVGVIGPALDPKGNSVAGVHLLEALAAAMDWCMF